MKSKYYFPHTATVFFLLTVAVALFSWIGSIYGLGKVQSLLSPEGIRWGLRHAMGNFVQTPALGIVMMLFLGFGITVHSGVWGTLGRIVKREKPISRKEKHALILSGCILLVYIIMIICTTFAPWTMLRSVTGSLTNSPFQKGIYYLISFGVGLSGMAFGYASGRFRDDKDKRYVLSLFSFCRLLCGAFFYSSVLFFIDVYEFGGMGWNRLIYSVLRFPYLLLFTFCLDAE